MLLMEVDVFFLAEKVQKFCCFQSFRYFFFLGCSKKWKGYVLGNARKSIPTRRKMSVSFVVEECA